MSLNLNDKSTMVWVMGWCCQSISHFLGQCWPRCMYHWLQMGCSCMSSCMSCSDNQYFKMILLPKIQIKFVSTNWHGKRFGNMTHWYNLFLYMCQRDCCQIGFWIKITKVWNLFSCQIPSSTLDCVWNTRHCEICILPSKYFITIINEIIFTSPKSVGWNYLSILTLHNGSLLNHEKHRGD